MLFGNKKCRIIHVTTLLNYEMDASVSSYTRQPKDAGNTSRNVRTHNPCTLA
jgi:hypothetical protein